MKSHKASLPSTEGEHLEGISLAHFVHIFTQHYVYIYIKAEKDWSFRERRKLCDGRRVKHKTEDVVTVGVKGKT